jgi:hypothetical protein
MPQGVCLGTPPPVFPAPLACGHVVLMALVACSVLPGHALCALFPAPYSYPHCFVPSTQAGHPGTTYWNADAVPVDSTTPVRLSATQFPRARCPGHVRPCPSDPHQVGRCKATAATDSSPQRTHYTDFTNLTAPAYPLPCHHLAIPARPALRLTSSCSTKSRDFPPAWRVPGAIVRAHRRRCPGCARR